MMAMNLLDHLDGEYRTILADPPWPQGMTGRWKARHKRARHLPYPTMLLEEIIKLPVGELAGCGAHLWLWTTNQYLRAGFDVMDAWGFRYLAPVTWVKPSGMGCWFIHRTQTLLMGYKGQCVFNRKRYRPTILEAATPTAHSTKPHESYELIEAISDGPRLEMFARSKRDGWDAWGNEV